jgi:CHAD domain-containing protein
MLTRQHLRKFVRKRCRHVAQHLSDYCTTHDPEALHLLRVEIKKLKAFGRLLHKSAHHQQPNLKSIKPIFIQCGLIRTALLNLDILQHRNLEHETFIQEQKRIIAEESALLCNNLSHYQKKLKHQQTQLMHHTHAIHAPQIKTLFRQGVEKLGVFFSGASIDTAGLHEARKEVKDLMYIHALLPLALVAMLGINIEYLQELQSRIGTWHDNEVTLSLLKQFGQTDPTLIEQLEKENTSLIQDIKDFTTDFDQKIHTGTAAIESNNLSPTA